MDSKELLERFRLRQRGSDLPFVLDDTVEILDGMEKGRRGVIELVAYAETPIQYLVDFLDGTDECFPASLLKLIEPTASSGTEFGS